MHTATLLITSRNRACQLEALLRSAKEYCNIFNSIIVLWSASDENFLNGYRKLLAENDSAVFICNNWRCKKYVENWRDIIQSETNDFICISTDDTLFYRRTTIDLKTVNDSMKDDSLAFSLRLGRNTFVQDYSTGHTQPFPNDIQKLDKDVIKWNWRNGHAFFNYWYPIGMDGVIYRSDILRHLVDWEFDSLRAWESRLCIDVHRELKYLPSMMCSLQDSVAVNIPYNNIQDPPIPIGARYPVTTQEFNKKFLAGEVLDFSNMDFSRVVGCHQEIEAKFKCSST